jgi:HAMP domain-containing protein/HPt (histidine-containing phosphotransfer) domain-containing protein
MFIFTIRKKIWFSFGILVALLIAVGFISQDSLQSNKDKLATLVNDVQPAMEQSLKIVNQLDRASASLGFYLLSKEDIHKKDYLANMSDITESITALSTMKAVQEDAETLKMVQNIEKELNKLQGYKARMLGYATSDAKNIPGIAFAANTVNPLAQSVMQNLQQMLQSESSQKVSTERRQLLMDIVGYRANFVNAINEMRVFLAFRAEANKANFKVNAELATKNLATLNKYNQDMLTFEEQEALENINKVYNDWLVAADQLFIIHGAENWRQDAFVIRKNLSPLVLKIQDRLNSLVKNQQSSTLQSSNQLTEQVQHTQTTIGSLILFGLISALLIAYLLARSVTKPIDILKDSAYQLAHGKLNETIDTSGKDELGSLAKSFSDMRDSIVKTFSDLTRLNHTGEALTSMHDPIEVLEHALAVMSVQTDVEWGSVYLYNTENQQLEVTSYYPQRDKDENHNARTFKLGEGILGQAAQQKEILYIPDTSKGGSFEAKPGDDTTPRAIICVPMIDNENIFGVMNFCGHIGKVKFGKTDHEFAETLSRMAVVSFKNIQMLNVIAEQNRTLEQKVEERTAELRQKTNDINNMMQNMHQGIFTILPGGKIHPEYSAYLESIVETKQIANENVMDLLFSNTTLGGNALSQISAALDAILDEDEMMFDFNRHCLVGEFTKIMPDGKTKIMEMDWDPITGESGNVDKLMVTLRDVTALRGLQAEADKQKWELDVIGQILSVSSDKFLSFIRDAERFVDENEKLITQNNKPVTDVIATLFRNMHTIKGNARIYSFTAITDVAHAAEDTYNEMRKNDATVWDKDKMLAELKATRTMLKTYQTIYTEKLAGNTTPGLFVEQELLDRFMQILGSVNEKDISSMQKGFKAIKNITEAIGTESIHSILDAIINSLPEMANKLGKSTPKVVITDHDLRFLPDIAPVIKNVLTHSFRNSMDHGLETSKERKVHGKPDFGTITVDVNQKGEQIVLQISDDGRGLPVSKLKQKAIQNGTLKPKGELSDHDLSEMIFQSGLSTAESVSDISGRGVGMDAIRKFIEKAGGKVGIQFKQKPDQDSEFLPFILNITLPSSCAKQVA